MMKKTSILALMVTWCAMWANSAATAEPTCDSLYYELQDLSIQHIRANEIWVDYLLDCPPVQGAVGAFILSDVTNDGASDRALVAVYRRPQWRYQFGERGPNIRFAPTPRMDIDGDGMLDFVFVTEDARHRPARSYRFVFLEESGKQKSIGGLGLPRGVVIDSIVPAPGDQSHDLIVADRQGWDIGGLSWEVAPVSYQYLEFDNSSESPEYVNRTAAHVAEFPKFAKRRQYIEQLPAGRLEFHTEEEYETFLINVIGHSLDLNNMGRGAEAYEKAADILERARFSATTVSLRPPRTVQSQLKRVLPQTDTEAKNKP